MRSHSRWTVATVACLALLAGACGDDGDDAATPDATTDPTATAPADEPAATGSETAAPSDATPVAIVDFAFEPADVSVAAGTAVAWSNDGDISHTVTFSDGGPDSGTLAAGDTFAQTFDEPGSYSYVCRFHGQMQGTVEVG